MNAARVSFHKESDWEVSYERDWRGELIPGKEVLSEKDAKLVAYLAKHGHWTPFAHAFLSFRIKAPIFVARQLVKHQVGLAWNEVSRRYVNEEPEFFQLKWRWAAENVKQGSAGEVSESVQAAADQVFWNAVDTCLEAYNSLLDMGIAAEQARAVLNLNAQTEWIWSGSLAAFARVVKLRVDLHAQAETREIAEAIQAAVPQQFEHSWKALLN